MDKASELTTLLNQNTLDQATWDQVLPLVYHQLKHLARQVRTDHASQTLNTTALVHDAYLKIKKHGGLNVSGRQHFYRLAACAMRQILIDAARSKLSAKRAGQSVPLEDGLSVSLLDDEGPSASELLAINAALEQLKTLDADKALIVELHFFAGYGFTEIADILEVSESTVYRDWKKARAWLYAHLKK